MGGLSKIVHTAHVGDTRAVLCRGGHAMRLTAMSDHKPTDHTELMRIHSAGGAVFNGRVNGVLAIARALGDQNLKAPLQQGDFISNVPHVTSMHLEAQDEFIIMAFDHCQRRRVCPWTRHPPPCKAEVVCPTPCSIWKVRTCALAPCRVKRCRES